MKKERRYVDCRFSPGDCAKAVQLMWSMAPAGQEITFFSVSKNEHENIRVDDIDQFLMLTTGPFESFQVLSERAKYSVDFRIGTDASRIEVGCPSMPEIDSIFSIFDEKKEAALVARSVEILPTYSLATRAVLLHSCKVTCRLLEDIEAILVERVTERAGISRTQVCSSFTFTVKDRSNEHFPRVASFGRDRFRDGTHAVSLVLDASERGRRCKVELEFAERPTLSVSARCPSSREIVDGLVNELFNAVSEQRLPNRRWAMADFVLRVVAAVIGVPGFFMLSHGQSAKGALLLAVAGAIGVFCYTISLCKPDVSFDSPIQAARDDWFQWAFRGFITFAIFTVLLNTFFTGARRQWLGW